MPRIEFSGNTETSPTFIGDFLSRDYLLPGGVKLLASGFNAYDAVVVTLGANEAIGQTNLTTAALPGALPAGAILDFGSGENIVKLASAAAAAATDITITEALTVALESGDTATYPGTSGKKRVVAGTLIGRTFTERDAGTAFGPAADADDEVLIVAYDIYDLAEVNDGDVLRRGTLIKENLLPGWSSVSSALKAKVRAFYQTTTGTGGA